MIAARPKRPRVPLERPRKTDESGHSKKERPGKDPGPRLEPDKPLGLVQRSKRRAETRRGGWAGTREVAAALITGLLRDQLDALALSDRLILDAKVCEDRLATP